jgi:hypothetical protein
VPRQAGGDPRVARHIATLLPRLSHAAADDVVDRAGVDVVALEERPEREAEQVGRVPVRQRALRLPMAVRTVSTMTASRAPIALLIGTD